VKVDFIPDASNNTTLKITASTSINTFFMRILPQWKTMTIANTAQSLRAHVIVELVLDKSWSMTTDCSGSTLTRLTYLQQSVTNFINYFNDTVDRMGMVSFSSCSSNDLPVQVPFKAKMKAATLALKPNLNLAYTASSSGMGDGWKSLNNFSITGGEITRTGMVFFTDGFANTFSNTFNGTCIRNIAENRTLYNPSTACSTTPNSGTCTIPASIPSAYPGYTGFNTISTTTPNQMDLEAEARAVLWANQARGKGVFVYAIGLNCDTQGANSNFLAHVANVNGVENPDDPWGIAIIAPTGEQLRDAFERIAKAILLRLAQ
jgi:hypothetical protein